MAADQTLSAIDSSKVVIEGPAYGLPFKAFTIAIAAGLGAMFFALYLRGDFASGISNGLGWFIAGFGLILIFSWFILTSRTRIEKSDDGDVITQSWMGDKRVTFAEIGYVRFVFYPAFTWLVAPRMYMALTTGKIIAIYLASQPLYEYAAELEKVHGRQPLRK